jgi:hypothetical protein
MDNGSIYEYILELGNRIVLLEDGIRLIEWGVSSYNEQLDRVECIDELVLILSLPRDSLFYILYFVILDLFSRVFRI